MGLNIDFTGLSSLVWSIAFTSTSFVFFFAIFWQLKSHERYKKYFQPRELLEEATGTEYDPDSVSSIRRDMERLKTPVAQIWYMVFLPDEVLLPRIGLDGLSFLFILRLGIQVFTLCTFVVSPLLMALNILATDNKVTEEPITWDRYMSMSNVRTGSIYMSVNVIFSYIITFFTLWRLARQNEYMLQLRIHVLYKSKPRPNHYTILVRDIPDEVKYGKKSESDFIDSMTNNARPIEWTDMVGLLQLKPLSYIGSASAGDITQLFGWLYHGLTVKSVMVPQVNDLEELLNRKNRLLFEVEWRDEAQAWVRRGLWGVLRPLPRQSRQAMLDEAAALGRELALLRKRAANRMSHTAFVHFPSIRTATVASQVLHAVDRNSLQAEVAPLPEDIIWSNLHLRWRERWARTASVAMITTFVVLTFMVPITLVAGAATTDKLTSEAPWLRVVVTQRTVKGLWDGYLSGALTALSLAAMPSAFAKLSSMQSLHTLTSQERSAANKFYWLLVVDVFFGLTFIQAAFRELESFLDDWRTQSALTTLANSLPDSSVFYISFVMARVGMAFPGELLRIPWLLQFNLLGVFRKTEREWREALVPTTPFYRVHVPHALLVLLIGYAYAVVTPMVAPFCLFYMCTGYVLWVHQLLFTYVKSIDTVGELWPWTFTRIVTCLIIGQSLLIMVLVLQESAFITWELLLPIITYIFYYGTTWRFKKTFDTLPLDIAAELDDREGHLATDFREGIYFPPVLRGDQTPVND
eukprot:CAMPEP_0118949970 /NCGR_PEP_ID=MMETSP1169-20130426/50579_1 /TAXON_ID=36882 /ORGANISM="Pyramimonas obovata, Strain CCMP722" /LENGTH=749 /DNA_ID=CAMNT_0006896711 /DNA_START=255 /DNA_END=2504 /DNA_ORIENTATION=+